MSFEATAKKIGHDFQHSYNSDLESNHDVKRALTLNSENIVMQASLAQFAALHEKSKQASHQFFEKVFPKILAIGRNVDKNIFGNIKSGKLRNEVKKAFDVVIDNLNTVENNFHWVVLKAEQNLKGLNDIKKGTKMMSKPRKEVNTMIEGTKQVRDFAKGVLKDIFERAIANKLFGALTEASKQLGSDATKAVKGYAHELSKVSKSPTTSGFNLKL